jgi:hypothetical protein
LNRLPPILEYLVFGALIGAGATALLDVWIALLKLAFGQPSRNWAMVGRWVGYWPDGRFVHQNIAAAAPVRGELALGWAFHYFVGMAHGVLLLAIWGLGWVRHPTLLPGLVIGLALLVAPFFVMDPALGAGIAASRSAHPTAARARSVMNHTVFGLGLYLSAWFVARMISS